MRSRLLRSTLAIALLAVVTLGVPLLLLARHQVWSAARATDRQLAGNVAAGVDGRLDAQQPLDLRRYAAVVHGRRIVLVTPSGVTSASGPTPHGAVIASTVEVDGYVVSVQEPRHAVEVAALQVTALVGALALVAVGAAVALARRQAATLAAPLAGLLARADALGRGAFAAHAPASGIPEIDGISRALSASARQVGQMIELQRDFASDAAHQLRTPLTGIGLRLDELIRIGGPAVRQEAEDALGQVERLDGVITSLLARARGDAADPRVVDLADLLRAEEPTWAGALGGEGRELVTTVAAPLPVLVRPEHVSGAVTCLLENAMRHGAGRVFLDAGTTGDRVCVRIRDEGPGVPAGLAERIFERRISGGRGSGIGLALARSLVTAEGGTLELGHAGPSEFVLSLPRPL